MRLVSGRPPDTPIAFQSLKLRALDSADLKLVIGCPVRAFVIDVGARTRLAHSLPLEKIELFDNWIFFRKLDDFYRIQSKFNEDVMRRSERLILDTVCRPNSTFMEQPTIAQNKVIFRFSGASLAAANLAEVKPAFLETLFGLDRLMESAELFNESVLFRAKDKPSDFFLAIGCISPEAASGLHTIGQSLHAEGSLRFAVNEHQVELREIFSCKAQFGKGAEPETHERWYQVRFSRPLVARNVEQLNTLVGSKFPGVVSLQPRVCLGHPVFPPKGICYFASFRLPPASAVGVLSDVVSCFDQSDLALPLSTCVSGPYNPGKSVGVCFVCGCDHTHRLCPKLPQLAAVAAAVGASSPASASPASASSAASAASPASAASAAPAPSARKLVSQPCRLFNKGRGFCFYGVTCKFVHLAEPQQPKSLQPARRVVVNSRTGLPVPVAQPPVASPESLVAPGGGGGGGGAGGGGAGSHASSAKESSHWANLPSVDESKDQSDHEVEDQIAAVPPFGKGSGGRGRRPVPQAAASSPAQQLGQKRARGSPGPSPEQHKRAKSAEPSSANRTQSGRTRTLSSDSALGPVASAAVVQSDSAFADPSVGQSREPARVTNSPESLGNPETQLSGMADQCVPVRESPQAEFGGSGTSRAFSASDTHQAENQSQSQSAESDAAGDPPVAAAEAAANSESAQSGATVVDE
jgi:hypothetical protein